MEEIHLDINVEPFILHLHIELRTRIIFTEMYSIHMTLNNFLDSLGQRGRVSI